jgi:23S rRNA (cytosine1962-C5)-methyltransferase
MKDLFLRQGADHRLRGGHLWVFSNEVDSERSPLGSFAAGDLVTVRNSNDKLLGSAYMEPNALICARLYAPGEQRALDVQFFAARIATALAIRQAAFDKPFYRLIYGDSDTLPGLVVDRFGDVLVMQLNNSGMERYREPLLQALVATLAPSGILLRSDSRSRREQGLATESEVAYGAVPRQVPLQENGVQFLAPVYDGQKTGWFYDHRMSRARLAPWVRGKRVLDVLQLYRRLGCAGRSVRRDVCVLPGLLGAGAGGRRGKRAIKPTA